MIAYESYEEWMKNAPTSFRVREISKENVDWSSVGEEKEVNRYTDSKGLVHQTVTNTAHLDFNDRTVNAKIMYTDIMDGEDYVGTEFVEVLEVY